METEIQTLLDSFADLRKKANVTTCFGKPVTAEGHTVIPVAEVGYGFGMGFGQGSATEEQAAEEETGGGGGGGGGVKARPLAVVEVTPDGTLVKPVIDEQKVALAGVILAGWAIFCLARALVKIFGQQE
ncbi:MAG: spore germination protein GerW family protein [Chloroflexota bacterium]|nr:spore germination protein GerW family protein [Chloroflexota bacterium]